MLPELNSSTVSVAGGFGDWTVTLTPTGDASEDFNRFSFEVIENLGAPATQFAAIAEPANRVQSIDAIAADTALATTFWYGDRGVDINGAFTRADVKAALEAIDGVTRVDVLAGAGENWDVRIVAASTDANGDFYAIRAERFQQGAFVIQSIERDDVDHLPFSRSASAAELATQSIYLAGWQDHAAIRYGGEQVEITRGMSGADITTALESLDNIGDVWVSGSGSSVIRNTLAQQSIDAAAIVEGSQLHYGDKLVTLDSADIASTAAGQAAKLQQLLRALDSELENNP